MSRLESFHQFLVEMIHQAITGKKKNKKDEMKYFVTAAYDNWGSRSSFRMQATPYFTHPSLEASTLGSPEI